MKRVLWVMGSAVIPVAVTLALFVLLPSMPLLGGAAAEEPVLADQLDRESFLLARLEMSRTQAIGLALDLVDSTYSIEFSGIPLRTGKLEEIDMSRSLRLRRDPAPAMFSLVSETSTIPKEPVRVVVAPRDSAEAAARPPQEVPVETRSAYVTLTFSDGLVVRLVPTSTSLGSALRAMVLDVRRRLAEGSRVSGSLLRGERPAPPDSWIDLHMAPDDIRALYRALPVEAQLALRTS